MLGQIQIAVRMGLSPSEARTALNEGWRVSEISDFARNKARQQAAKNQSVRNQLARVIRTRAQIEDYIRRLNTGYKGNE
jgi:DNA-binding LacI/PurR family transcriptional regulator